MKSTLTKQIAHDLSKIAREINGLEQEIQQRKSTIIEGVREFDCRVIEIGLKLLQAELKCPRGEWSLWLQANVSFSERTARRYMSIARNPARVSGAGSLREALALLSDGEESENRTHEAKQLLPGLALIGRLEKTWGWLGKQSPQNWPEAHRAKAWEDLTTIASGLAVAVTESEREKLAKQVWPEGWR